MGNDTILVFAVLIAVQAFTAWALKSTFDTIKDLWEAIGEVAAAQHDRNLKTTEVLRHLVAAEEHFDDRITSLETYQER